MKTWKTVKSLSNPPLCCAATSRDPQGPRRSASSHHWNWQGPQASHTGSCEGAEVTWAPPFLCLSHLQARTTLLEQEGSKRYLMLKMLSLVPCMSLGPPGFWDAVTLLTKLVAGRSRVLEGPVGSSTWLFSPRCPSPVAHTYTCPVCWRRL